MKKSSMVRGTLRLGTLAAALFAAQVAMAALDPATGTLTLGTGGPGNTDLKVEVGPSPGQVRVVDNLTGSERVWGGVRGITLNAGAGDDVVEFDINASQSLALSLNSGSGRASYKIQWKVPVGAAAATSSLAMSSGGGDVAVELAFESEVRTSSFSWVTNFGGGNKILKSSFAFRPGTATARKNVNLANLGGGVHQVLMDVDNDAADGRFTLNSGAASEVLYKVVSDDPTTRLDVNGTVRGAKNAIEVISAAPTTNVALRGGTANTSTAETNLTVVQTVPGLIAANFDFVPAGFGGKTNLKFDGSGSRLSANGRLLGSLGDDEIKFETVLPVSGTLAVDCRAGLDLVQIPFGNPVGCETVIR